MNVKHLIALVDDLVNSSSTEGCTDDLIVCDATSLKPLIEFVKKLKKQVEQDEVNDAATHQAQPVPAHAEIALPEKMVKFIEQLAGLSVWGFDMQDGTPFQECPEPSDGFLDSHTCLMDTILEARALKAQWSDALAHFVIYSPNESVINDGAGFWNNTHGWTDREDATKFTCLEAQAFALPMATGQDARWTDLRALDAPKSEKDQGTCKVEVSLDGGTTFAPAPCGVRVIYKDVQIPGEGSLGELHINATHEGVITDIWATRDEPLDHNIGTESVLIEDTVVRLVEDNT